MDATTNTSPAVVMQQVRVRFNEALAYATDMGVVSSVLDGEEKAPIAQTRWKAFGYKPEVQFSGVHSGECFFLKFYVEEKTVVAAHGTTHAPVYKDSCVEFFIAFDEGGYYNFEFNSTGTCLAAFGPGREGRSFLPEEAVAGIRRRALIDREPGNEGVRWTLTLAFPLSTFVHHLPASLRGLECHANFYKCGDDLPEPHFLCWAVVETMEPDFHQPRYFGALLFE